MGWLRRESCLKSWPQQTQMSCRIDRVVSAENLVVLFISGRITGEHVDILRGVLEQESGGFAIGRKRMGARRSKDWKEERISKMFNTNRDGLDRHSDNGGSRVAMERATVISGLIGSS